VSEQVSIENMGSLPTGGWLMNLGPFEKTIWKMYRDDAIAEGYSEKRANSIASDLLKEDIEMGDFDGIAS